jgi:indolepyruvate ferredoxin oxidoreductase
VKVSLEDRYVLEKGRVHLTGVQALVRLPFDQSRRDRRSGLRVGAFISGYPGSPLGGYDLALEQAGALLRQHQVIHVPGANEEIAATALIGTQMLERHPHSKYDGVTAFWYGKGPGVDRAGDALKHGNFAGTSRHGAVVILSGEDHEAKSSTLPFQDDYAFMSAGIPILYPSSVQEFLELGLHAVALSRYSGCWVALKLVAPLCDAGQTVDVDPQAPRIRVPELQLDGRPFQKRTDFTFFPGTNLETERHLYCDRHAAVRAYGRLNGLDSIELQSTADRVGIISSGKSFADLRQALLDIGLDDDALVARGVRLLRIGLIYPLDAEVVREFAKGLLEVIVVEEKRPFLEAQVKEALCGVASAPRVVGKLDEHGRPLLPIHGGFDSDLLLERIGPRLLAALGDHQGLSQRLAALSVIRSRAYEKHPGRTPNYCSGCPHNTSTRLLEGQIAWGSPGCHSFASIIEQPHRHIEAMTQLGGEGLPWVGLSPFTDQRHMVQNVGDGSLFHSSYLNIRFCVAAGVNITFKILYNGYVANTGAQQAVGGKSVPELTRLLALEGVRRIAVVTKEPRRYPAGVLAPKAEVYPVSELDEVARSLEQEPGVTVLLYDEMCANERRRQQKRGKLPKPDRFVVINPAVCENCGHCGALTNCMSLQKVETELGLKTQVHQSSCNQDTACLEADCPSFVTVETRPGTGLKRPTIEALGADESPEPTHRITLQQPFHLYTPGVGGTGVITVNAILSYAALIDGLQVLSYDQTGAAQKWGPVLSSLILAPRAAQIRANKVGLGKADLYLAFDAVSAATAVNLDRCDPSRTVAVINTSVLPTGEMIRNVQASLKVEGLTDAINRFTRADSNVFVEARRVTEALFGDSMATNMFTVGAAYQAGRLPISARSIEEAIRLNGTQVEINLQAFRYGRLSVADPSRVAARVSRPKDGLIEARQKALARLSANDRSAAAALLQQCADLDEEAQRLLAVRVSDLIQYQDVIYAREYVEFVREVGAASQRFATTAVLHPVIRYLYKLMAYKDEYEVARLHLAGEFHQFAEGLFSAPQKLIYNLHPPFLRALGVKTKLRFGPWFTPALRLLRALRRLRGTWLDLFGYARVRRVERHLIGWYKELVRTALRQLSPQTLGAVRRLLELPDAIRGYEDIKLRNVALAKNQGAALLEELAAPPKLELASDLVAAHPSRP